MPIPDPLCVISDGSVGEGRRDAAELVAIVTAIVDAGVRWIQLREKQATTRQLFDLARELRAVTRAAGAALTINDRIDVALAVDADGVQLGWQSLDPGAARELVAERCLIGVSTHDETEARRAIEGGCDHIIYGPIHDTESKRGLVAPRGTASLAALAAEFTVPIVAVGGIERDRVRDAFEAGAAGVAVVSSVMSNKQPAAAARSLLEAIRECRT